MELVVRQHLIIEQAVKLGHGSRAEIETKMLEDEVLFAWSIASVELDDKTNPILLKMIVELWIRGFPFAGAFIEQYKSATKKGVSILW